jgi:site-specific DNA recombinase
VPDPAPLVPAIGYIRVSMVREEMISPQTQRAAIRSCAARKGYAVIDWAEDLDATGRNFKRKIMNVIARVKDGEAEAIIVWKFSRFGRQRKVNNLYIAELEEAGGRLVSATEDVDTSTATGKFQRGVLLEVSAFESDRAGETWAEAYGWRAQQGLPPFGRPRFGYRQAGRVRDEEDPHRTRHVRGEEEKYVPDLARGSDALAAAYRAHIGGEGFHAIAGKLNAGGWQTSYGGRWRAQGVRDVLDSGFGAGLLLLHDPACRCGNGKARCPSRAYLKGAHDPVIGPGEWQAYRRRRAAVAALPARSRAARYPVTGLARCGHCRSAMVASGYGGGGIPVFTCSRRRSYGDCEGKPSLSVTRITDAVREAVEAWAGHGDVLARDIARSARRRDSAGTVARLEAALAEHDRQLVNIALSRARAADPLGDDAWKEAAAVKRAERDAAAAGLAGARELLAREPGPELVPVLAGLAADWDRLPVPALNGILRSLVRRVAVYREGERTRDRAGWWKLMPARIEVLFTWDLDPWENEMPEAGKATLV